MVYWSEADAMTKLPYQQAFDRIRAEFFEMPGMRLTPAQVERLTGVDRAICQAVLGDLTRTRFLQAAPDGSYGRVSEGSHERLSAIGAPHVPRVHVSGQAGGWMTTRLDFI
jgi:hypothetical protein